METKFKGVTVTHQAVLNALSSFASLYPDSNDYEDWLDDGIYKYAIDYDGKLYPPKHILSQISGVSTTEFSGGAMTNRVFRQLGFTIVAK